MRPALAGACFRGQIRGGFWVFRSFFREQIQGPENGSIARLDGLGCYGISSGNGVAFGARGRVLESAAYVLRTRFLVLVLVFSVPGG